MRWYRNQKRHLQTWPGSQHSPPQKKGPGLLHNHHEASFIGHWSGDRSQKWVQICQEQTQIIFSVPSHKSAITFFISDLTCEIGVVLGLFLSNLQHLCPVTGQWLARKWAHAWCISASRFPSSILGKVERALKGGAPWGCRAVRGRYGRPPHTCGFISQTTTEPGSLDEES
jgi:hypothetical protein